MKKLPDLQRFCLVCLAGPALNLLHAEISHIIDTTCHWPFFPILPVLATFWNAKTLIFFIFQVPIFVEPYHQTYVHQYRALITWLKHTMSPYFDIVWVLFYNI